jgi:hypothetical protein
MSNKTINITVSKYYTDTDGIIIDKNTLPNNLQEKIPFYLFGKFDKDSHYPIGRKLLPPLGGVKFYNLYNGSSYDFLIFSGANQIRSRIKGGDMVIVYTDDPINPNYFIWIVVSGNLLPIDSIFNNLDGTLRTDFINYESIQNRENYGENLQYVTFDKIGNQKTQTINPQGIYLPPSTEQNDILRMDLKIVLNNFFGLYSYILFDTDNLSIALICKTGNWEVNNSNDFKLN